MSKILDILLGAISTVLVCAMMIAAGCWYASSVIAFTTSMYM